jgi:UDP:flavonoid glycosyltransferase YjiC (YdhE family)
LERFLESGDRPVFIGFGSPLDPDSARTVGIIRDAVKSAGVRAVIPSTWAETEPDSSPDKNIFFCRRVPYTAVFPRMAGVIHHGGAGTLYTAAWAGAPQMGIPHFMDEYYLADRIFTLGLGPAPIRKNRLNARNLAKALTEMVHEKRFSQNAAVLGKKLAARNGSEEMANLVLQWASRKGA